MNLSELQKFLEATVPGACVPVDLLKIGTSLGTHMKPTWHLNGAPPLPLSLVVDGENCLDRLYGGYFNDWVCGGQWNRMMQFLSILVETIQSNNIALTIFFNGSLEPRRMAEWIQQQLKRQENIKCVIRHVKAKQTPPPKLLWVSPTGIRMSLRMALRQLNVQTSNTMDDHHQEVIEFCRENNYRGLMAEDSEYVIFDPPRYFSSRQLKLTYKGSLETKELILSEVGKALGLPTIYFCYLAALLENNFLRASELKDFYKSILPSYQPEKTPQGDLVRAIVNFILQHINDGNLLNMGAQIFGSMTDPRVSQFKDAVQYFINGTKEGFLRSKGYRETMYRPGPMMPLRSHPYSYTNFTNDSKDITFEPPQQVSPTNNLPHVPHEVLETAAERHQKGLMHPWIHQVLAHGELRFEPSLYDNSTPEIPNPVLFFQPIRQSIYGILFNLHHYNFMAKKSAEEGKAGVPVPTIRIREWVYSDDNPYKAPLIVDAAPISWAVPTVQRMWFGSANDDKKRRLRAFVSCMNSDSPLMLYPAHVPQHMLIMATVLRFIMSSNFPVLRKQELDAFLVAAFSPALNDTQYTMEMQVTDLSARSVSLASFFMAGVEAALFANDACGCPVLWQMCCPWYYFDGKLFHHFWARAEEAKSLTELCKGDMELIEKVTMCRDAILEDLKPNFASPHPHIMPNRGVGLMNNPFYPPPPPPPPPPAPMPRMPYMARGRSLPGGFNLYSQGGQLEIAGVVVGQWGPNYGSTRNPNARNRPQRPVGGRVQQKSSIPKTSASQDSSAAKKSSRPPVMINRKTIKKREDAKDGEAEGSEEEVEQQANASYNQDESVQNGGGPYGCENVEEESNCVQNGDMVNDQNGLVDGMSNLAVYSDLANDHSGLKSPDSGVNVSIME